MAVSPALVREGCNSKLQVSSRKGRQRVSFRLEGRYRRTGTEKSACTWVVPLVRSRMSRLRFASLDMTLPTNMNCTQPAGKVVL